MRTGVRYVAVVLLLLVAGALPACAAEEDKRFDALKRFSQVLDIVEHYYVRDASRKDLIDDAVKGMLQGLDPHSTFMTPDEYKEMKETTSGEFFGIGIEISMENGQVTVVAPIEDTPAFRAGLQSGDTILTINNQSTQELSLQEVVSRIRGAKGTEVELSILHRDATSPQTLRIVRDAIPLVSVKARELEAGYHWVRLTRFSERTTQELHDALQNAAKKGPVKGLVLDLRNNPGGLLDQSVSVADTFLREGTIVSIRGRHDRNKREYSARKQPTDVMVPLVVLVNAGSASASEIVAGALRDQKRALIIGERTFGKGSVQNIIPLSDGSGLKLTVALYYTPNGTSIQAEGVAPDLEIPLESPREAETEKTPHAIVREKDLPQHLENARKTGKAASSSPEKDKKGQKSVGADVREQLDRDNQLRMALQMIKSLPRIQEIRQ